MVPCFTNEPGNIGTHPANQMPQWKPSAPVPPYAKSNVMISSLETAPGREENECWVLWGWGTPSQNVSAPGKTDWTIFSWLINGVPFTFCPAPSPGAFTTWPFEAFSIENLKRSCRKRAYLAWQRACDIELKHWIHFVDIFYLCRNRNVVVHFVAEGYLVLRVYNLLEVRKHK